MKLKRVSPKFYGDGNIKESDIPKGAVKLSYDIETREMLFLIVENEKGFTAPKKVVQKKTVAVKKKPVSKIKKVPNLMRLHS